MLNEWIYDGLRNSSVFQAPNWRQIGSCTLVVGGGMVSSFLDENGEMLKVWKLGIGPSLTIKLTYSFVSSSN